MKDPVTLVQRGDLRTLQYIAKINPEKLHQDDGTSAKWKPIHEAVRSGHLDILKFLIEEGEADKDEWVNIGDSRGKHPIDLATELLEDENPILEYLTSIGARSVFDDGEEEL